MAVQKQMLKKRDECFTVFSFNKFTCANAITNMNDKSLSHFYWTNYESISNHKKIFDVSFLFQETAISNQS